MTAAFASAPHHVETGRRPRRPKLRVEEVAAAAAQLPGPFTRRQLARALHRPVPALDRPVARLLADGTLVLAPLDGTGRGRPAARYHYQPPPVPEPAGEPEPFTDESLPQTPEPVSAPAHAAGALERARDAAVALDGAFSRVQLARAAGCRPDVAGEALQWMLDRGIVTAAGLERTGRRGRPAQLYVYVPPVTAGADARFDRDRRRPDRPARFARAADAPTGRRPRSGDKEVDALLAEAERAGCRVERGGRFKIRAPDGHTTVVGANPGDCRALANDLADLRRHGVKL